MITLIDENSTPTPRQLIGSLLQSAAHAEIAVSHVRLGAIDLADAETNNVQRCRVLLDRLDAGSLASLGHGAMPNAMALFVSDSAGAAQRAAERAARLLRFITSDRVELRSAGINSWRPDFSLYRRPGTGTGAVCLVGAHYFGQPPAEPAFTCMIDDPAATALALARFEHIWDRSHDVRDVVIAAVSRLADANGAAR